MSMDWAARAARWIAPTVVALVALAASCTPMEARAGGAEQSLITHYYQTLLRRAPDAGGLAFWDGEAGRLRAAGQDPKEAFIAMATQFVDSAEYRSFGRTPAQFLTDLYLAFFRRTPDAGGLAHWQEQLAQGLPRGIVLTQFLFSMEFHQFIASQLGGESSRPEGTLVIDLYRGYLSRLPDSAGLAYWVTRIRDAQCSGGAAALRATAELISAQLQSSAEFAARGRSNGDFVADLYGAFLRRGGDLAGVRHWVARLEAGVTRDALRRLFLDAPEFQLRLAAIAAAGCYQPRLEDRIQAARLLQQATWGSTATEIARVAGIGPAAWLEEQFALPAASYVTLAEENIARNKQGANGCTGSNRANGCPWQVPRPAFYKRAFEDPDQLRQRVSNALLQIMVVSIMNNRILDAGTAMPSYLDMLGRHAFGNFRGLLRDMTLHPAMGVYLDMLGSSLEVPNENFARELLQVFSIGTVLLEADGRQRKDGQGQAIAAYDEDTVKGFARALTGWHFADQDMARSWKFYWPDERWTVPMKPWTGRRCPQDGHWPAGSATWCDLGNPARSFPPPHDTGTKKLLQYPGAPYAYLPGGQSPEKDLEDVIDNVFHHPNVGPFIGKQLIQRLVTSNPTPAYVARVAAAFANDGHGTRGDMKAVIRAILLDPEARSAAAAAGPTYGRLREPVWKFIHLHRAFGARASGGYYDIYDLSDASSLNQSPLAAPSVFNFFGKDFAPGGVLAEADLVGPEFELATAAALTGFADFTKWAVFGGFGQGGSDPSRWIRPDYGPYLTGATPLADRPQALVDELDVLLAAGNLKPTFKADLVAVLEGVKRGAIDEQRRDRLRIALWQITHSAEYAVQR